MKALLAAVALAIAFGTAAQAAPSTQVNGNPPSWVAEAFSHAQ
jgi:hypothetical protein